MDTKQQLSASRATEKASRALYILATHDAPLKDRLVSAAMELTMLTDRPLPGDFQEDYDAIHEDLTAYPGENPDEGAIHASIRHLSDDDAAILARRMVRFALDVEKAST